MSSLPTITIRFFDPTGTIATASTQNPRKCIIKSGFGAMERRCWLELYNEDLFLPVSLGTLIEIWIDQTQCFRGRVVQRRIDSIDDQLSLYAIWEPHREHNISITSCFEYTNVTAILAAILLESNLTWPEPQQSVITLSRLSFMEFSLFGTIDLLAKIAGNWIWDIDDNANLRFRPYPLYPDHQIFLAKDHSTVNIWETVTDVFAKIEFHGGRTDGSIYEKVIEIPQLPNLSEEDSIRIYVRSINTTDVYLYLRKAITQQMNHTHYEHYIDLIGWGETIQPGDTVQFQAELVHLFPQELTFRVKMREIEYAHGNLKTRLHLTSSFESSSTYFYYFTNDRKIPELFMTGDGGPFQLDVSALDSPAHLDFS